LPRATSSLLRATSSLPRATSSLLRATSSSQWLPAREGGLTSFAMRWWAAACRRALILHPPSLHRVPFVKCPNRTLFSKSAVHQAFAAFPSPLDPSHLKSSSSASPLSPPAPRMPCPTSTTMATKLPSAQTPSFSRPSGSCKSLHPT
jgi:hypothetical protein